jgi:hypothetical protein
MNVDFTMEGFLSEYFLFPCALSSRLHNGMYLYEPLAFVKRDFMSAVWVVPLGTVVPDDFRALGPALDNGGDGMV